VKPYISVFLARFQTQLQYRVAALSGVGTQCFWGIIRIMLFDAFYRSTNSEMPITLPEVITYVWLGQAFLGIIGYGADPDVRQQVRTGTVAYEMLRPVDIPFYWLSRAMAMRVGTLVLRATPILILSYTVIGISWPYSWASFAAWIASLAGALLLSSALATVLTTSLLWTISGDGVSRMMPAITYVLSGMAVPLPLYPDWMQPVLNFLPFRGLIDIPFRFYLGHIPASELLPHLAHQFAWIVGLLLLSRALFARGRRNLVIQGG
jgi:ABC-2 type transport system permease protein